MDVRGASAEAVAALTDELTTRVGPGAGSPEAAAAVADSLYSIAQTLRAEAALRRFVTDGSVPAEAKVGVVRDVLGTKADAVAIDVVASAVSRRWTSAKDLADALEHLSEVAAVRSAGEDAGRLADELFALGGVVQENPALRDALSDPARSLEDKGALLESLLGGKALPATITLAKQALGGTYRTVSAALEEYTKVAASVRDENVATVRVAQPLTDAEQRRLGEALARQYGRQVHLNIVVDPAVLGGIKVEIGDDVIDGTVASRLDEARRLLAG